MLWTKPPTISDPYLKVGLAAVKQAEKVILSYYQQNLEVKFKANYSPVTVADTEAESVIKKVIQHTFPDHGFIGEEAGSTDHTTEFTWIIDPIDGTKPYVRGLPYFGTILALLHHQELIAGISYLPKLKSLAYAVKGRGAFVNHQPIKLSSERTIKNSYITTAGIKYFEQGGYTAGLAKLGSDAQYLRSYPELWGWHLFFQGKFDAQIEGAGQLWDFAAHGLITQEAGGIATDLAGQNYTPQSASILASNSFLHPEILQYFREK